MLLTGIVLSVLSYMGLTARQSGGGLGAKYLPAFLPEILFSLPFGIAPALVLWPMLGWYAVGIAILASVWSYAWMQSATAPGLHWGNGGYNPERKSRLKPFVDFLNRYTLKADPSSEAYCWLYMGVKGFLIGLPVGGVPLALLWPLGYELGDQLHDRGITKPDPDAFREVMAGVGAGISIILFALVFGLL